MKTNKGTLLAALRKITSVKVTKPSDLAKWEEYGEDLLKPYPEEKHLKTLRLGNLYHHIFDVGTNTRTEVHFDADTRHILSEDKEPFASGLAMMYTGSANDNDSGYPAPHGVIVDKKHRGKGLGYKIYIAVINFYNGLESDDQMTPEAHRIWLKLAKDSRFKTELSEYPGPGNHVVEKS